MSTSALTLSKAPIHPQSLGSGLPAVEASKLNATAAQAESCFDVLKNLSSTQIQKTTQLENDVASLQDQVKNQSFLNQQKARDLFETLSATLERDITALKETSEKIENDTASFINKLSDVEANNDERLDTLENDKESTNSKLTSLENQIKNDAIVIKQLRTDLDAALNAVDALKGAVVGVLKDQANAHHTAADKVALLNKLGKETPVQATVSSVSGAASSSVVIEVPTAPKAPKALNEKVIVLKSNSYKPLIAAVCIVGIATAAFVTYQNPQPLMDLGNVFASNISGFTNKISTFFA